MHQKCIKAISIFFFTICRAHLGSRFQQALPPLAGFNYRHFSDITFDFFSDITFDIFSSNITFDIFILPLHSAFFLTLHLAFSIDSVRYNAHRVTGTSQCGHHHQYGHPSGPGLYIRAKRPTIADQQRPPTTAHHPQPNLISNPQMYHLHEESLRGYNSSSCDFLVIITS